VPVEARLFLDEIQEEGGQGRAEDDKLAQDRSLRSPAAGYFFLSKAARPCLYCASSTMPKVTVLL